MYSNDNKRPVPIHLQAFIIRDNTPRIRGVYSADIVIVQPYGYYGQL